MAKRGPGADTGTVTGLGPLCGACHVLRCVGCGYGTVAPWVRTEGRSPQARAVTASRRRAAGPGGVDDGRLDMGDAPSGGRAGRRLQQFHRRGLQHVELLRYQLEGEEGVRDGLLLGQDLAGHGPRAVAHAADEEFRHCAVQAQHLGQLHGGFGLVARNPLVDAVHFLDRDAQHVRIAAGEVARGEVEGPVVHHARGVGQDAGVQRLLGRREERVPDHPGVHGAALERGARVRRGQEDGLHVAVLQAVLLQQFRQEVVHVGALVVGHAPALQVGHAADGRALGHHHRLQRRARHRGAGIHERCARGLGEDRRGLAHVAEIDGTDIQCLQLHRAGVEFRPGHLHADGREALLQRAARLQQRKPSLLVSDPQGARGAGRLRPGRQRGQGGSARTGSQPAAAGGGRRGARGGFEQRDHGELQSLRYVGGSGQAMLRPGRGMAASPCRPGRPAEGKRGWNKSVRGPPPVSSGGGTDRSDATSHLLERDRWEARRLHRWAQRLGHQQVERFVQPTGNVGRQGVGALGRQGDLGIRGIHAGQDVPGPERLQHGPQSVVERQHVVRAAAGGQRQHRLALERLLRQQVEEHLQHAAVGGLVHRRRHDQGPGVGHLFHRMGDGPVARVGQQQRLGGQVADVQPVDRRAAHRQSQGGGIEQRGGTRALRGASGDQEDGHGQALRGGGRWAGRGGGTVTSWCRSGRSSRRRRSGPCRPCPSRRTPRRW